MFAIFVVSDDFVAPKSCAHNTPHTSDNQITGNRYKEIEIDENKQIENVTIPRDCTKKICTNQRVMKQKAQIKPYNLDGDRTTSQIKCKERRKVFQQISFNNENRGRRVMEERNNALHIEENFRDLLTTHD